MKFKDAHENEEVRSDRTPTGLTVNAAGIFEKMDNITLHCFAMEEEVMYIYFKTKLFCVVFTVINVAATILINLAMR